MFQKRWRIVSEKLPTDWRNVSEKSQVCSWLVSTLPFTVSTQLRFELSASSATRGGLFRFDAPCPFGRLLVLSSLEVR
jgi:hypothetical protein